MKIFRTLALLLTLMPGVAFSAELGVARISLIRGDVQIYTEDTGEWVPASINMPLREGDRIWAPEGGRTEIQIEGGVYVRLDANTSLDILALQEESFQFYTAGGHVYINNRRGGIEHIQVDTPLSSVGCYDNSLIMIDVAESGATDASVIKGYAYAETREGKSRIEAGKTLHIMEDGEVEISPIGPPDEWERWNLKRDRKLAEAGESRRYLPDELDPYAYEMEEYGRWVYAPAYGYVWTPRLTVSIGWSPYRIGRWCWIGGHYVWVSYEPWGWVPYHYGRWAFVVNIGWCWVPPVAGAVYWGPGYVGWVYTPTYVAWVPLSPGEIYYGYGYYGPWSVNITNVAVDRTVIRNYRNVSVSNAVTTVHRDTFIRGTKGEARIRENPFRRGDVSVGPPAIKPDRATRMPVIRSIPPAKRPPERVRRTSVEQIRRERKVIREERGSVFRPGRPTGELPVIRREEPRRGIRIKPPQSLEEQNRQMRPQPQRPSERGPEIIRGRPIPPATREVEPRRQPETAPAPQVPQRREAPRPKTIRPEGEKGREIRQQPSGRPTVRGVEGTKQQPAPAVTPKVIRERPTMTPPPSAFPAGPKTTPQRPAVTPPQNQPSPQPAPKPEERGKPAPAPTKKKEPHAQKPAPTEQKEKGPGEPPGKGERGEEKGKKQERE
ncbi:MAG: FecR domain-containing protein [Geobacter sp.]|nr:FecR domain-containing protein [Geobacter sp.]